MKKSAAMTGVSLRIELNDDQAWQLAQFVKRVTFRTLEENSTSSEEAYLMMDVMNRIREELREQGYAPR